MKREGIYAFFRELCLRKVYRAAAEYAIAGWIIIQVVAIVFPVLGLPAWSLRAVVITVLAGFPLALALAWAFELGLGGVRKTVDSSADATGPPAFARICKLTRCTAGRRNARNTSTRGTAHLCNHGRRGKSDRSVATLPANASGLDRA